MDDLPVACDLTLLSDEQRRRKEALRRRIASFVEEKRELDEGYRLRFRAGDPLWMTIGEFVDLERLCCPFLAFSLTLDRRGASILSLTGPRGTKAFLASQLGGSGGEPQPDGLSSEPVAQGLQEGEASPAVPAAGSSSRIGTPPRRAVRPRGGRSSGRSKLFVAAGSAAAAVTAALCCVGPALLALLGIAGAGLGAAFKSERPYFVAAALALLAAGVYLFYRRRSDDSGRSAAERSGRRGKALLWTAVAASALLLGLSFFL